MYVLCVLNTELPYLQGYNDNLTRFLLVLESEVDFQNVRREENDFTVEGMIKKTGEYVCTVKHASTHARTHTHTHTRAP